MKTYEVAVAAPIPKTLTYGHPEADEGDAVVQPGMRVLVPLGRRKVTGYVLAAKVEGANGKESFAVKPIAELLDPEPIFPESLIPFYRWIADYYHFPLGEAIKTALPGGLISSSRKIVRLTEAGHHYLSKPDEQLSEAAQSLAGLMLESEQLTPARYRDLQKDLSSKAILRKWLRKGWLCEEDELQKNKFLERKEFFVTLTPEAGRKKIPDTASEDELHASIDSSFPGLKKSEIKTLGVLFALREQYENHIPRPEITRRYSGAGKGLKSLTEKGIVAVEQLRVYRDPFGQQPQYYPRPEQLTADQEKVLAEVEPFINKSTFQTFLLHGVTGCGKTEVYLRAAELVLAKNGTVLVLVPEIALSSQLEAHFYSRFGDVVAVLHSGLSSGERHDQWQRISRGEARVVVGARSAVFAPLAKPGLIIVDEEHEPAYKQEDGLRYNGRDLAILRARFAECPVILGSATPSITSYQNTKNDKYKLLEMPSRIAGQKLPDVEVVDLGSVPKSRPDLLFSDRLISALWENMEKRQQSLLFVNRRGFASFVMCKDCGHIVQCRHCQVSLTLHRREQKLICHYCGYTLPQKLVCPSCNSPKVEGMGIGSERIEEEVRQIIPHARVARLDSDTATSRRHHQKTLRAMYQQDVDILVGTQMIAKGLHFPNITLVGVIWADSGLGIPDFRASERTFQLLAQVTGRAGRGDSSGRVIIQTYQPHHYAVQCARKHDYQQFVRDEVELREDLQYPPFSRLVNIKFNATNEKQVQGCAEQTAAFLRKIIAKHQMDVELLGPAPAPLVKIKDRVRWQLLLKGNTPNALHNLCYLLQEEYKKICPGNIRLSIDVDPESMM